MEDSTRVPTNLRLLMILEILSKSKQPLSVAEINRDLDLPKPSIYRLCQSMVQEGFITYMPDQKRLRPSKRSRDMALGLMTSNYEYIQRHRILSDLSLFTNETINFAVPDVDGMRYLSRVETEWPLRITFPIGTRVPFHASASGKCFLAYLPKSNRDKFFKGLELKAFTAQTIVTMKHLIDQLDEIKAQGYSFVDGEFMENMTAIAVPVFDDNDRFLGALTLHGPNQRLTRERMISFKDKLQETAEKLRHMFSEDEDNNSENG